METVEEEAIVEGMETAETLKGNYALTNPIVS